MVPICPFVNLPETRKERWGEALTAEKMKSVFWFGPGLSLSSSFWNGLMQTICAMQSLLVCETTKILAK